MDMEVSNKGYLRSINAFDLSWKAEKKGHDWKDACGNPTRYEFNFLDDDKCTHPPIQCNPHKARLVEIVDPYLRHDDVVITNRIG